MVMSVSERCTVIMSELHDRLEHDGYCFWLPDIALSGMQDADTPPSFEAFLYALESKLFGETRLD